MASSDYYEVPNKQFRWNWGAFANPIVFGFANKTYKTIIAFFPCLIPCLMTILWVLDIIPGFVLLASLPLLFAWNVSCGLFAERWVWATGQFEDGTTFRAVMDSWNRAGLLRFITDVIRFVLIAAVIAAICFLARDAVISLLEYLNSL